MEFDPVNGDEIRIAEINNRGEAVGTSVIDGALSYLTTHAFLYTGGKTHDLGTLPGGWHSGARAINDAGQIVGFSSSRERNPVLDNGSLPATEGTNAKAVLWQNRRIYILNDLIPAGSGWVLIKAADINERGEICGSGIYANRLRAFLLLPQ